MNAKLTAARMVASAVAVVGMVGMLASPASAFPSATGTVTDNGNGTATVTYENLYPQHSGIFLCPGDVVVDDCGYDTAPYGLVTAFDNLAPSPVSITGGMEVAGPKDERMPLPAGTYTIVLVSDYGQEGDNVVVAWATGVRLTSPATRNLTLWILQIGRSGADDSCPAGYAPSWAQWPNGGTGGWVCTKSTYAYYPGEVVR